MIQIKEIKNSRDIKKLFKREGNQIVVRQSFKVGDVYMLIDDGAFFSFSDNGFVIDGINISLNL